MKTIVGDKLTEFKKTGKRTPVSEVARIIGYQAHSMIRETIKALIGNRIYEQVFGGYIRNNKVSTIEQVDRLVKETGISRYGIEGLITESGIQMLKNALAGNIPLAKAKFEIWCQTKGHKPFNTFWSYLQQDSYCKHCFYDSVSYNFKDAVRLGLEQPIPYILSETPETFTAKILKGRKEGLSPSQVKLDWICEYGHKNSKSINAITQVGCKDCYRSSRSIGYLQAKKAGAEKGYKLMSERQFYKVIKDALTNNILPSRCKLKWSCGKHTFWMSYDVMNARGTCPHCKEGYYEGRTRRIFKSVFGVEFLKAKVIDVVPRSYGFHGAAHFDGFAELNIEGKKLRIAFEYNGYQHYTFPNRYHLSYQAYTRNRYLDAKKVRVSMEEGIILIVVPHTFYDLSHSTEAIKAHIIREVTRQGRIISNDPNFTFKSGTYFSWDHSLDPFLGDK